MTSMLSLQARLAYEERRRAYLQQNKIAPKPAADSDAVSTTFQPPFVQSCCQQPCADTSDKLNINTRSSVPPPHHTHYI